MKPVVILLYFSVINFILYMDRTSIAGVTPGIAKDFNLDKADCGLFASVFMFAYMIASPTSAYISRINSSSIISVMGLMMFSLCNVLFTCVDSYPLLLACRAGVAIGQSAFVITSPPIITDLAPNGSGMKWLAVFFVQMSLGSAAGYILGGIFLQHLSWRQFYLYEAIAVLGLALLLPLFYRAIPKKQVPQHDGDGDDDDETSTLVPKKQPSFSSNTKSLLTNSIFMLIIFGSSAQVFFIGALSYWLPKFASEITDTAYTTVDFYVGVITVIGGIVGTTVGSMVVSSIIKKHQITERFAIISVQMKYCAIAVLASLPFIYVAFNFTNFTLFMVMVMMAEVRTCV